ncbi:MAG: ATP-binding protein, partial [Spirochaetia bacterium]|nr:ATP-binding protein [Spirochaetia bacterium]
KEYIPFIFNRFFRDPSLISKNVNGVGLGLWIVKELTTKMKGTIELESELGVGTKFKLKFPAPYL